MSGIETMLVMPATRISSWGGWPDDVVDTLHAWNKAHDLSFRYISSRGQKNAFRCSGCGNWHLVASTVAVLRGRAFCDPCLIVLARGNPSPPEDGSPEATS